MSAGKVARALSLAPLLLCGCLTEPSPNAPAAGNDKSAGEELLGRVREELTGPSYAEPPAADDVQRFVRFLRGVTTGATATLAAPGLSPHGQSRAFDFQVMRGSQLIAGPTGAGAWDSAGWTEKVRAAVTRASTKFTGPLASPREPWHYDYRP